MTTDGRRPVRLHVAPTAHPWADDVVAASTAAGADLVAADQAEALVWLGNDAEEGLDELLHPGIQWVQLRSAGIEGWLERGALDPGRRWTAARGIYAHSVAEHTLALILAGFKLLPTYARATRWDPDAKARGRLVRDATVAVVGAGGIGREVIAYLRPLGARTIAVTRSGRVVEGADRHVPADRIEQVWGEADVIVLAAPATAATRHLVDAAALASMRPDALLVNVARGSLVDTDALVACLARGGIAGAALDVTDPEPLPDGHPLWSEPRALITPHAANPGSAQLVRLCELVVDNLARYGAGEPLRGQVDLGAGY
jgi:phosphoglycerate dehydrogenase-like enzyme